MDAAIIFSDILVIPEAMGLPYIMEEKVGPIFPEVIKTMADVDKSRVSDPEAELKYVLDAIKIVKKELNVTFLPLQTTMEDGFQVLVDEKIINPKS